MKKLKLLIYTTLILFLSACAQDDTCRTDKNIGVRASFLSFENQTKLQIDSLSVHGKDVDSLLYDNSKNINSIKLPLNSQTENSIFILKIDEVYDTLEVIYTNKEYFISYACGMVISHELDTIFHSQHAIQEIKIINHQIDPTDAEHIQIYL